MSKHQAETSNSSIPYTLGISPSYANGDSRENALQTPYASSQSLNAPGPPHTVYPMPEGPQPVYSYQHYTAESWATAPLSLPADDSTSRLIKQDATPHPLATESTTGANTSVYHKHWDAIIATFLKEAGLSQALRGFESDMVVLNPDWEKEKVQVALKGLMEGLKTCIMANTEEDENEQAKEVKEQSLDERKLGYVHFSPGVEPRTPSTVTRSISRFLAQNRARNDASNRQEFLLSLAEKRRKLNEIGDYEGVIASCARTDAKTQNRDLQMKFDVAKNEDGPLRKTVHANVKQEESGQSGQDNGREKAEGGSKVKEEDVGAERYPGLDERLKNLEEHLAVRYVPSPPRSLLDRLKFIEDHLVHLEREYPPWAALHFNQPRRGWPPPPRPTPIIVPSHLTSSTHPHPSSTPLVDHPFSTASTSPAESAPGTPGLSAKAKGKQAARRDQSSLHRAVMEKLEVQKAMNDLAGRSGE
ncbi:hypothetical protein BDY19DRAFT_994532 [Irpex rosettiformis]|uniref:Uncharacterized protein n=1 Tax=Irpex rosettiformis TaxID=378272 RepID=A0ACB8U1M5_9APHY|nr:hypothetical protein BDY19DRAFT_994532 [Irpex rosettiformis]